MREEEPTSFVAFALRSRDYLNTLDAIVSEELIPETPVLDFSMSPFRELRSQVDSSETEEDAWYEAWKEREPGARGDIDIGTIDPFNA